MPTASDTRTVTVAQLVENSTLVEEDDDEHPRTYVPIPSTNASCHLTLRTRKRITADLPPSPVTREAVKRFKTMHNALITEREAVKRLRL
ncbi:hypothetical protein BC628DRAFT_1417745 [Trametes gibbosa]|nr:hypothetical protein BC628DRAFT_1421860 [Trametes gibbosa]KAI0828169.1 hypothetical protein BC628DRAFT_1417745 [Trametes gibbosa]